MREPGPEVGAPAEPVSAVHRTVVVVDVEGFGDRRRTDPQRVEVRRGLYRALRSAFERAGVSWDDCYHEDRGDAVFVLSWTPSVPIPVGCRSTCTRRPRCSAARSRVGGC